MLLLVIIVELVLVAACGIIVARWIAGHILRRPPLLTVLFLLLVLGSIIASPTPRARLWEYQAILSITPSVAHAGVPKPNGYRLTEQQLQLIQSARLTLTATASVAKWLRVHAMFATILLSGIVLLVEFLRDEKTNPQLGLYMVSAAATLLLCYASFFAMILPFGRSTLLIDAHRSSAHYIPPQLIATVYGVQTYVVRLKTASAVQNNLAISIRRIIGFLRNAGLGPQFVRNTRALKTPVPAEPEIRKDGGIIKNAPGAYRFAYVTARTTKPGAQPIADELNGKLISALAPLLFNSVIVVTPPAADQESLRNLCQDNNTVGIITSFATWKGTTRGRRSEYTSEIALAITDCSFFPTYFTSRSIKHQAGIGHVTEEYTSVVLEAGDQVLDDIRQQIANGPTIAQNLVRYGIPLAYGYRSPGFLLAPLNGGATVNVITPWGTASRAGLQRNDRVLTVNGRTTAGMSQASLSQLLQANRNGQWELGIATADGKTATLRFESEDSRWYLEHPLSTP